MWHISQTNRFHIQGVFRDTWRYSIIPFSKYLGSPPLYFSHEFLRPFGKGIFPLVKGDLLIMNHGY